MTYFCTAIAHYITYFLHNSKYNVKAIIAVIISRRVKLVNLCVEEVS